MLPSRTLDRLYPLPRRYLNEPEFERANHIDLSHMTLDELYAEQRKLRYRVDNERNSDPWLIERGAQIETGIRKRRAEGRLREPVGISWGTAPVEEDTGPKPTSSRRRPEPDTATSNRPVFQVPEFSLSVGDR